MNIELFKTFNNLANNNLNNKGSLAMVLESYIALADSLGLSDIAYKKISELPPASSFENPSIGVDNIIAFSQEQLVNKVSKVI